MSTQIYSDQTEVIYAYVTKENLHIFKRSVVTW